MGKKVGEILIDAGLIDEKQLEIALAEQAKTGAKLGEVLVDPLYTVSGTAPEPPGWNGPYVDSIPLDPWAPPTCATFAIWWRVA